MSNSNGSTVLFLVRHAVHADYGERLTGRRDDAPLTSDGLRQAAALAEHFSAIDLAGLHASPRERTQATAAEIGGSTGRQVTIAPALDEIDFGEWTGRRFADLAENAEWQLWNERRSAAGVPGGETMQAATARAVEALEAIVAGVAGGRVACVTHCDIIRGVIAHYLGLSLDNLLRFEISPGSVSTIALAAGERTIMALNETPR